jgi:hypothetical protein
VQYNNYYSIFLDLLLFIVPFVCLLSCGCLFSSLLSISCVSNASAINYKIACMFDGMSFEDARYSTELLANDPMLPKPKGPIPAGPRKFHGPWGERAVIVNFPPFLSCRLVALKSLVSSMQVDLCIANGLALWFAPVHGHS